MQFGGFVVLCKSKFIRQPIMLRIIALHVHLRAKSMSIFSFFTMYFIENKTYFKKVFFLLFLWLDFKEIYID